RRRPPPLSVFPYTTLFRSAAFSYRPARDVRDEGTWARVECGTEGRGQGADERPGRPCGARVGQLPGNLSGLRRSFAGPQLHRRYVRSWASRGHRLARGPGHLYPALSCWNTVCPLARLADQHPRLAADDVCTVCLTGLGVSLKGICNGL